MCVCVCVCLCANKAANSNLSLLCYWHFIVGSNENERLLFFIVLFMCLIPAMNNAAQDKYKSTNTNAHIERAQCMAWTWAKIYSNG